MKRYRNLVEASAIALKNIFENGHPSDSVVQQMLRNHKKWGAKDRRFVASTIYNQVRWYRCFHHLLGKEPENMQEWMKMIAIQWIIQKEFVPNWEEFDTLSDKDILDRYRSINDRSIKQSIPDWLDEAGQKDHGQAWDSIISKLNTEANLYIRCNTLKIDPDTLISILKKEGIDAIGTNLENCLKVYPKKKLTHLKSYRSGFYEVQDLSSQMISIALQPEKDSLIIDTCAGAGGKTLHLAALMKNSGKIIATDIYQNKLETLQARAKRASAGNVITASMNEAFLQKYKHQADQILMDVPCSGIGTLRRSPHIKWRFDPEQMKKTLEIQAELLKNYSKLCKKGGFLNYATCSIMSVENENQISNFLNSVDGEAFEKVTDRLILPNEMDADGFYFAKLRKT